MIQLSLRRKIAAVAALGVLAMLLAPAKGEEVISRSKNFKLVTSVPLGGITVGGQAVGDTYFVSSWQTGLYSFDISDPENPKQLGHLGTEELLPQNNENEDLATNGEILLLSRFNRTGSTNALMVIDVRNPKDMKIVATLAGAGAHTYTCLYDCKWAYGSSAGTDSAGIIIDLRNPRKPKLLEKKWSDVMGGVPAHDVTEVRPGLVVTSSSPMYALDVTDPAKPRGARVLTGTGQNPAPNTGHNNIWPRSGKDRWVISASEGVNNGRCEMYGEDGKTLQVWDTTGWKTRGFKAAGSYTLTSGTGSDGHPPVDALGVQGCSAHWAQAHPTFHNGGLVAMAAYSQGVRLLDVSSEGKMREVGWFLKDVHGAIDIVWVNDRIMYVIEDGAGIGGFDVIKYTGKL